MAEDLMACTWKLQNYWVGQKQNVILWYKDYFVYLVSIAIAL